jgi:hypothetical protein
VRPVISGTTMATLRWTHPGHISGLRQASGGIRMPQDRGVDPGAEARCSIPNPSRMRWPAAPVPSGSEVGQKDFVPE